MKVPFVDLSSQDAPLRERLRTAIDEVMSKGNYILGEQISTFEKAFADYCGSAHAVGVSSGLSALELILRGYDIGPGDEVIVPALTFVGTASAVALVGATPVLADVEDDFTISPAEVEAAITPRTKAIMAVHLYGRVARMPELAGIAEKHGLKLIEDAAQAHGATLQDRRAGTFGHAAGFSFYPSKNLGASGDAGIVTTDDGELAARIVALRNCGQFERNVHSLMPCNHRMDTLQAAILSVRLEHLDAWNAARRGVAEQYHRLISRDVVDLPARDEPARASVWHLYVVRSRNRDGLREHLADRGIDTAIHYPLPVHRQPYFAHLGYPTGTFPKSEAACGSILSLPMHPNLSREQVEHVARSVNEYGAALG